MVKVKQILMYVALVIVALAPSALPITCCGRGDIPLLRNLAHVNSAAHKGTISIGR